MAVREISARGAQVELDSALPLNSLCELRLTLGTEALVIRGRVVHCGVSEIEHEHITYRTGLEFVEPSDRVAQVLETFVETLRSSLPDDSSGLLGHLSSFDLSEA